MAVNFDPKYTEILIDHNNGYGYILRDTRTGKTKRVLGVTGHIHNVFSKHAKSQQDPAMTTFGEAAMRRGTSIHQELSEWVDSPRIFNKMSMDAQTAASMLVTQFPPSQGWEYAHDVPVTDYKKFASEIDLLVTNRQTGEIHIVDLKTGKWRGGEYNAQLSFYKRMWELGNPDQKVSGIWGLRTQEGSRGFVKADEFTPNQIDSIFYRGIRPKRVVNMNKGMAARYTNVLDHFEPAQRQSGPQVSRPITFFDVETGPRNEILQIGAIKGVFNKKSGKFQVIDRFARHFTGDPNTYSTQEWATLQETHGITPETAALRGKKHGRWNERHLNAFREFIGDSALAGHNIEQFDIPAIFGTQAVPNDIIDTLHIARNIRGNGVNKLGQLFALTTGQSMRQAGFSAHDALGDVMANARMFEGWLNRSGSPFQEYAELVVDNPGLSTIQKNTYTGAMVRMKDEEMTPEDLLSMNIGTGMGFEDLSDMLDEERATRLDNSAPPQGWRPSGGTGWGDLDIAELKALVNRQTHLTASLGEFTNSLSTSVFNHTSQIRNNMLRSMVDYDDDDARRILQRMYGDAEVDRNVDTIKTLRRAKYRGWAKREIEKAEARGLDIANMPEFHDLRMVADGATHAFTVDPQTGTALNTPLNGREVVLQARADIGKLLGSQGAINKAHALARYADYHGLHNRAIELRNVKSEDEFFNVSQAYNEDRKKQHEAELFDRHRHEAVRDMLYSGHQSKSAIMASLARDEEELWRARKAGAKELESYTKKMNVFNDALSNIVGAPGQIATGFGSTLDAGRGWSHNILRASDGFIAPELSKPLSHGIDAIFGSIESSRVRGVAGWQNVSNIGTAALTGATALAGLGPVAMAAGAVVGAGTQVIPSIFNSGKANISAQMGDLAARADLWSAVVGIIEAPFKMLARVTKDLTRGFLGLSAGISGILLGGLNKLSSADEHYASLTSMTHRQYQDTFSMDAWLGLKEGSVTAATEDAVAQMRTFLTSGEGQQKWANLALSNSLSGYLNAGDFNGVMNMVNDVVAQGHADPSRQRDIMANFIAAFGKGTLSNMVQDAWTHGVNDVRQFGADARARIHYRNLDEGWQRRIKGTRADWQMTTHGFDNAWMKITVRMWESFGRDIANTVLDIMNAFGDGGLSGGLKELKKTISSLWEAFTTEGGIGGTGFNLDSLLSIGKDIIGHVLKGLSEAVEWAQPYIISGMRWLMDGVISTVSDVAHKVEPLLARMSTYTINPDILKAVGGIFSALGGGGVDALLDAGDAILNLAKNTDNNIVTSLPGSISRGSGRVGVGGGDPGLGFAQYMGDYSGAIEDYFNNLRVNDKGKPNIRGDYYKGYSFAGLLEHLNRGGMSAQVFTLTNGTKFSADMIQQLDAEIGRLRTSVARDGTGALRLEQLLARRAAIEEQVGITFHSAAGGYNSWNTNMELLHNGYAYDVDEHRVKEYIDPVREHVVDMAGETAHLATEAVKSTLGTMGDNLIGVKIEVEDKRITTSVKQGVKELKNIVTNTGQNISDIINLNLTSASAGVTH